MSAAEAVDTTKKEETTKKSSSPIKKHRIYNFAVDTFRYASEDGEVFWTVPSSGELYIKRTKVKRLPTVAAICYENVREIVAIPSTPSLPITLTQPSQFDALDEDSPGYMAFTELLHEIKDNPDTCYHLLLSVGEAYLLADQPEIYEDLPNVAIVTAGMGYDQVAGYGDSNTKKFNVIGFKALNVLRAPAGFTTNCASEWMPKPVPAITPLAEEEEAKPAPAVAVKKTKEEEDKSEPAIATDRFGFVL